MSFQPSTIGEALRNLLEPNQCDRLIDLMSRMNDGPVVWKNIIPIAEDKMISLNASTELTLSEISELLSHVAIVCP